MHTLLEDRRRHLPVLFALLGAALFVNLFSAADYSVLQAGVRLSFRLGLPPQTRIILPPIGQISAGTHWFPARFAVELRSVDLPLLRSMVFAGAGGAAPLEVLLRQEARRVLLLFLARLALLAASGSVLALAVLGLRQPRQLLWGALAGLVVLGFAAGAILLSYDLSAFESLEYEGIIEAAPWALNLALEALSDVEELGQRVQTLAGDLYAALEQLEGLGTLGLLESDLLVLHVSDIHNNPIAYDFASQVIASFPVDLVLDTGDLTDWGTALEAEVAGRIAGLNLPYLFVTGNHDSPEVLERLRAVPNVVVVEGELLELCGLTIAGLGDPVAEKPLPEPAPLEELSSWAEWLNTKWSAAEVRPDIFMVHNHRIAQALTPGLFPVVLCGHTHIWGLKQVEDSVYINAGTTGAAGIRGFQGKTPLPYSLALLYFRADSAGKQQLQAVDSVEVAGLGLSFALQRTFIEHGRNREEEVEITD